MIDLTLCRVAMTPGEATHTVARGDQPAQHPGDLVAPTSHVKNVSGITDERRGQSTGSLGFTAYR